jgi:hypothetical protein
MRELLRQYETWQCGSDGYPYAWHDQHAVDIDGSVIWGLKAAQVAKDTPADLVPAIKDLIRDLAGHRCQRCGHPYRVGEVGERGEWSPCDERCSHGAPYRIRIAGEWVNRIGTAAPPGAVIAFYGREIEAQWRILTVHHLTNRKADCRWGNLAALCQRCHLAIQGKVKMDQVFPFEHSEWFKPHAAWWYAVTYLNEENPSREEVMERLDDLLALERAV